MGSVLLGLGRYCVIISWTVLEFDDEDKGMEPDNDPEIGRDPRTLEEEEDGDVFDDSGVGLVDEDSGEIGGLTGVGASATAVVRAEVGVGTAIGGVELVVVTCTGTGLGGGGGVGSVYFNKVI